jgi:predicted nuclease with TOPRIM domain
MAFNNKTKKNDSNLKNNEFKESNSEPKDPDLNILNFLDSSFDSNFDETDSNLNKNNFDDDTDFNNNFIFNDLDNQISNDSIPDNQIFNDSIPDDQLSNDENSHLNTESNFSNFFSDDYSNDNFNSQSNDFNNEYDNLSTDNDSFPDFNQENNYNEHYDENKSFVDVRIITDNLNKAEIISKSIKNMGWIDEMPITISSIIPTNDLEIAVNTVKGADIVLITVDYDFNENILNNSNNTNNIIFRNSVELDEDTTNLDMQNNEFEEKTLYYKDKLKDFTNYLGILKFPKIRGHDLFNDQIFQKEIKNSIINIGLSSVFNISKLNQVTSALNLKNRKFSEVLKLNEKLNVYNNLISNESESLKNENNQLKDEVKTLNLRLDEIKSDFTDFKSRFSNIDSKNILEVFQISNLWKDSFNEVLNQKKYVILATNKFKPDNIIIGQDYIAALSKDHAVEWLKIIKTALIFLKLDLKDDDSVNFLK